MATKSRAYWSEFNGFTNQTEQNNLRRKIYARSFNAIGIRTFAGRTFLKMETTNDLSKNRELSGSTRI